MNIARIKYTINDKGYIDMTESKVLVKDVVDIAGDNGHITVLSPKRLGYTLLGSHPFALDHLYIGKHVGVMFTGDMCPFTDFDTYLEVHCPVVYKHTISRKTKVHTITFTDVRK